MNTDSDDSPIPDDHGLIMDSAPATHDDTGDNLDLVVDASTDEPGIHSGPSCSQQQSSSSAVSGDLRCVNCGLNVSRMRRHTLEISEVRNLIQRWIGQVQVSSDNVVCHACWTNAWNEIRHPTRSEPVVGHVNVCISCGTSLLRKRSHTLNTNTAREAAIRNMVAQQIAPRQLTRTTLLCHTCWRRIDRAASHSALEREPEATMHSPHLEAEADPVAPTQAEERNADLTHSNQILMSNYIRAPSTQRQCFFPGCNGVERLLVPSSLRGAGYLKRADRDRLHEIFLKYATVDKNGERFITSEDFVRKFLGLFEEDDYNAESVKLIAGIVDMDKDGYISFSEFQAFEGLLCVPDALYKTAFQLFDTNGNGLVAFDEFAEVMRKTALHQKLPFNMESTFVRLYFGKDKKRLVTYPEFSQFLHDFHEEYGVEAFKKCDKDGSGFITAGDFRDIMLSVKKHLLTKDLNSKVINASGFPQGERKISFPYYMAFNSLLNNMELIKRVYLNATNGTRTQEVTKEEFLHSAQMMSQITPLEVDILFTLCDMIHHTNGRIVYNDLNSITPEQYFKQVTRRVAEIKAVSSPEERGVFIQILESTYRFTLGSIAGAVGASAVYPIDLVKTRMQNQRTGSFIGEVAYRNSWDCFKKVIRHEGLFGLYRGLVPQLIGVAPEKAIKLTMNDLVRDKFTDKKGNIPMYAEILAGACAGGSQVVFTNPLEIVKIRLQVAGEIAGGTKVRAWSVVKDLGLFGLYKGAKACLLRDVPFSAIYFPAYAHVKAKFADENGYNHPLTLLAAGAIAGIPAASLVTPADVIKTRLQVVARSGQTTYNGVIDATRKIYAEEGARAFWKGAVARVFRSSPQFGVTLVTYEILQRLFFVDFGGSRPAGSELNVATPIEETMKKPHHIGGYQVALPVLTGLETKFGISLPRWAGKTPPAAAPAQ